MWRRFVVQGQRFHPLLAQFSAPRQLSTVASDTKEDITKRLAMLKEECRGQALDLSDMSDAVKLAAQGVFDGVKPLVDEEHAKLRAKIATLAASVKVYTTRLSNLQHESQSIQGEVDALVKLMWGAERAQDASFASAPADHGTKRTTEQPTVKEDPAVSFNPSRPSHSSTTPPPRAPVERVEAEPGAAPTSCSRGGPSAASHGEDNAAATEEIVVETIEVEVGDGDAGAKAAEPLRATASHGGKDYNEAASATPGATPSIADITRELFERGVDFSDCLDAQSLRQRYKEVLARGSASFGATQTDEVRNEASTGSPPVAPAQPSVPERPRYDNNHTKQQHSSSRPPDGDEQSLSVDPYPNALRKLVDTSKFVWQLKQELAKEQNIDPNTVELWSNNVKLDDSKRIYDYPTAQNYPLEVRSR